MAFLLVSKFFPCRFVVRFRSTGLEKMLQVTFGELDLVLSDASLMLSAYETFVSLIRVQILVLRARTERMCVLFGFVRRILAVS